MTVPTLFCSRCERPYRAVRPDRGECPNCSAARDRVERADKWARPLSTAEIKAAATRLFGTPNHRLPRRPKHRA